MSAAIEATEGTATMKATEIADTFDFYGAQFNSVSYTQQLSFAVVLKRHLPKLLPVMADKQNSVFRQRG